MLRLRLRVIDVREDPYSDHISVFAVIESDSSNGMRVPIVQNEEQRIGEEFGKHVQSALITMGVPVLQKRKPLESAVSFLITKQQYFAMGKPAVTDYIEVNSFRTR